MRCKLLHSIKTCQRIRHQACARLPWIKCLYEILSFCSSPKIKSKPPALLSCLLLLLLLLLLLFSLDVTAKFKQKLSVRSLHWRADWKLVFVNTRHNCTWFRLRTSGWETNCPADCKVPLLSSPLLSSPLLFFSYPPSALSSSLLFSFPFSLFCFDQSVALFWRASVTPPSSPSDFLVSVFPSPSLRKLIIIIIIHLINTSYCLSFLLSPSCPCLSILFPSSTSRVSSFHFPVRCTKWRSSSARVRAQASRGHESRKRQQWLHGHWSTDIRWPGTSSHGSVRIWGNSCHELRFFLSSPRKRLWCVPRIVLESL